MSKRKLKLLTIFASYHNYSLPSCNRNDEGCTDQTQQITMLMQR